jgi:DNA invertase Pin-like site-specific DNA recombinase
VIRFQFEIINSYAREESRLLSLNVTWGQRKRFADGKVSMPYKRILEKEEDDTPKILEKEAKFIRLIHRLYMEGKTTSAIARELAERGILSPGCKEHWQVRTATSILMNGWCKDYTIVYLNG